MTEPCRKERCKTCPANEICPIKDNEAFDKLLNEVENEIFKEYMKKASQSLTEAVKYMDKDRFVTIGTYRFEKKTYQTFIMIAETKVFNEAFEKFLQKQNKKFERRDRKHHYSKKVKVD